MRTSRGWTTARAKAAPLSVILLALLVVSGVVQQIAQPSPTFAAFPDYVRHGWGIMLALGGLLSLVGVFRARVRLEMAALQLVIYPTFAYAFGLVGVLGLGGITSAVPVAGFAAALLLYTRVLRLQGRVVSAATAAVEQVDRLGDLRSGEIPHLDPGGFSVGKDTSK